MSRKASQFPSQPTIWYTYVYNLLYHIVTASVRNYRMNLQININIICRFLMSNLYNIVECLFLFFATSVWKNDRSHMYSCPRDCSVSRHHGGKIEASLKQLDTSQHYHIEGLKGGPLIGTWLCWQMPVSQTPGVIFSIRFIIFALTRNKRLSKVNIYLYLFFWR